MGPNRRMEDPWKNRVDDLLSRHSDRLSSIDDKLHANTQITQQACTSIELLTPKVTEIYELLEAAKGFFAVCTLLGKGAKWVAAFFTAGSIIALAAHSLWGSFKQFIRWPW